MSTSQDAATSVYDRSFFGHPGGLSTLFFTEMWERFSYYGMRAILLLYMTNTFAEGGLGFDEKYAGLIYGTYVSSVWYLPLPGGWLADRILGAKRAVLIGAIVIACGHYSMAINSNLTFFAGLILIACGTGLLKPNISAMVGQLYSEDDKRRDSGFSIFYMGINLGAFLAPLAVGFLAQSETSKNFIAARGFNPTSSWHWGFAAAGVGMTLGIIQYVLGQKRLAGVGGKPDIAPAAEQPRTSETLSGQTVAFVGKLAGINRKEAKQIVRAHGGLHVESLDDRVTLVVVGEEELPLELREAAVVARDDPRRSALEDVQGLDRPGELRHDLDRRRAAADHGDAPAREVDVVAPACRVPRRSAEVVEAGGPGQVLRNHSTMDSARMIVPTRVRNILARSHRPMSRLRRLGQRYSGSSISSG